MWVSKKKYQDLEKRIADLEVQVRSQPGEILNIVSQQLAAQMTKSSRSGPKFGSQSGGRV